ncbi:hypothetical protein V6N13_004358 [Hibiscus sabdariffa]|uniref:Uncharacterized protein n=1 Tax=Hibiscus sabdariffa TaxID=183260 RepID=A0ABR2RYR5_9ROSI
MQVTNIRPLLELTISNLRLNGLRRPPTLAPPTTAAGTTTTTTSNGTPTTTSAPYQVSPAAPTSEGLTISMPMHNLLKLITNLVKLPCLASISKVRDLAHMCP